MHEVLVNRLGGLSLPRKSVVRLTDRPDMILDVYRGRKTTTQQQQVSGAAKHNLHAASTVYRLKAALLSCKGYVPDRRLHFNCARLLSVKLFLTVAQTGCSLPTFNESGLI